jgi:hypothetical protein
MWCNYAVVSRGTTLIKFAVFSQVLNDKDTYSLWFHIRSRLGQRHGHQSTTLTSIFYKDLH